MKISLSTDATHYKCGTCGCVKLVWEGVYKAKVAVNDKELHNRQNSISYFEVWTIMCHECFTKGSEESED